MKAEAFFTARAERLLELWRFYKIGLINTVFGFAVFSSLIYLGMNLYAAQLTAHVCGVAFNYYSYSRHVFRDHRPRLWRFVGSYAVNYLIGLAFLTAFHHLISSAYAAGFVALLMTSVVNYAMLKLFVFRQRAARDG